MWAPHWPRVLCYGHPRKLIRRLYKGGWGWELNLPVYLQVRLAKPSGSMLAPYPDWVDSLTLQDTDKATELPERSLYNRILTRKLPSHLSD